MWWWICFVVYSLYDFSSGRGRAFLELNLKVNMFNYTRLVMLLASMLVRWLQNIFFHDKILSEKTCILLYQEYYRMGLKSLSHCKYNCGPVFQNILKLFWLVIDVKHVYRELMEKAEVIVAILETHFDNWEILHRN
jgi:hypothetical protein